MSRMVDVIVPSLGEDVSTVTLVAWLVELGGASGLLAGLLSSPLVTLFADQRSADNVLYGYLAAVTTSIELATGVLILPQRQTALVAKQAVEVGRMGSSSEPSI